MSEESTSSDLERARRWGETANSGDYEAMMSFWAPNAVWDLSPMGLGTYEGESAIRSFFEDWLGAYDSFQLKTREAHDLGNGVIYGVVVQTACPAGSTGSVEIRYASVGLWRHGLCERNTNYSDLGEARSVAERLAEERG